MNGKIVERVEDIRGVGTEGSRSQRLKSTSTHEA
jgi:hypothetical protein